MRQSLVADRPTSLTPCLDPTTTTYSKPLALPHLILREGVYRFAHPPSTETRPSPELAGSTQKEDHSPVVEVAMAKTAQVVPHGRAHGNRARAQSMHTQKG